MKTELNVVYLLAVNKQSACNFLACLSGRKHSYVRCKQCFLSVRVGGHRRQFTLHIDVIFLELMGKACIYALVPFISARVAGFVYFY